jgi:hypothetical protein
MYLDKILVTIKSCMVQVMTFLPTVKSWIRGNKGIYVNDFLI